MSITDVLKIGGTLHIGLSPSESWYLTDGNEWYVGDILGRVCYWNGEEEHVRLTKGEKTCLKSYLTYLRNNKRGTEDCLVYGIGNAEVCEKGFMKPVGVEEIPQQAIQAYFSRTFEMIIESSPLIFEVGKCVKLEVKDYGEKYIATYEGGITKAWQISTDDGNLYLDGKPVLVPDNFKKMVFRALGSMRLGNVNEVHWYRLDGSFYMWSGTGIGLRGIVEVERE